MQQFDQIKKLIRRGETPSEELLEEVENLEKLFTYGLVWDEEHPENYEDFAKDGDYYPYLESEGKKTEPTGGATHIVVKGDNYHALTVFQYTHQDPEQKVDLLLIDPPYNTGEQFSYNDKIVNKDDPYRHTKWLSFMKKRLLLAKDLLTETGVLMVCINDKEFAQLKILLDTHIFSEDRWLGTLTWKNKSKPINSGSAKFGIQQNIEYILVYSKTPKGFHPGFTLPEGEKREYKNVYGGKKCRIETIECTTHGIKNRETMKFPILGVYPRPGKRWQLGEGLAKDLIKQKRIALIDGSPKKITYPENETEETQKPFYSHLSEKSFTELQNLLDYLEEEEVEIPEELLPKTISTNIGTAEEGKKTLTKLIGQGHGFDTVKPLGLIRHLLQFFPNNIRILDFFAGSGTTLHAVSAANQEDNGTRQCILVTNDDNGIFTKVCKPRLEAALKEISSKDGIKYYSTNFTSKNTSKSQLKRDMARICHEMACLREEVLTDSTSALKNGKWRFSWNDSKVCGTFFDPYNEESLQKMKEQMDKLCKAGREGVVYAFSYDTQEPDPHTVRLLKGYRVVAIPDQILHLYEKCYGSLPNPALASEET